MTKLKLKINTIIFFISSVLLIVILFIDNDTLNSLCINYDDNLVINQINTNIEKEEIPVNTNKVDTIDNSNVTLINAPVNKWVWPTINNYVITGYYSYYHPALDIASSNGSNIYAANSGTVVTVKGGCVVGNLSCNGRGGNYIVIKHNTNNYYTVYMHLKNINVSEGQVVTSGQLIGTMGNTGNVIPAPTNSRSTAGTHLHFSLYVGEPYKGGYTINPMNLY